MSKEINEKDLAEYRGCFIHDTQKVMKTTGINLPPSLLRDLLQLVKTSPFEERMPGMRFMY